MKGDVEVTDGVECHAHTLTGHGAVPSVKTDAIIPARAPDSISIPRKWIKPPDLPSRSAERHPDEPDGCGNPADMLSVHTDMHSIGNGTKTAENGRGDVRMGRIDSRKRNSLYTTEVGRPEPTYQWRKISVGNVDVYVPWNMPVEALGTMKRTIAFGQVKSGDEAIAPSIEDERADDGVGNQDGDGTTSGGSVDSMRVNATLLAVESQHLRWSRRKQNGHLPVSSWPPIQPAEHPYGGVRP